MKKNNAFNCLLNVTLSFVILNLNSGALALADETVSAPTVVAPAQPAAAQAATTVSSTASAAPAATAPGLFGMAMPFIIMVAIMYFLMIRPQQKRLKEHQALVSGLKNGDEVVTSAGIIGTIAGMSDKVVTLEVSKNVQLKVLRSQVNQVVKGQIQDIQANT